MRFAWVLVILALLFNVFTRQHQNWILITADLLAFLELLRTFPRNLTLASDGLLWRGIGGLVLLPWERISCFAKKSSAFGTEYKLCGDGGQSFVVDSMVFPGVNQIVRRISVSLEQRHLKPSSVVSRSILDTLHRLLLPACIIIIFFGASLR